MSLPPSPDAQRWRERRLAFLVALGLLVTGFGGGFWMGWKFCEARFTQDAAEQLIQNMDAYRAAQCASLAPALYPPC